MSESTSPKKKRVQQLELLAKDTKLSRRKLPKFQTNPFVDDQLLNQLAGQKNVYFTQATATALYDHDTDTLTPARTQIIKTIRADKEQFVKIFTTHLKAFFELNATSFKMLQYVLFTVQTEGMNKDTVFLNLARAQEYFENHGSQCSSASYYKGMKELVEKLFIAETTIQNFYYINPKLFFNGDRTQFITNFELEETTKLTKHKKDKKQIENDLKDEE